MIQWSSLNRAVKDVALEGYSPGERVFIVVDDYFWERVAAKIDSEPAKVLDFLAHELKESWRVALRAADNGGQSMVFPLVALQLFAAHKMRKEGDYGANAYNPRLLEILSKQGDVAWLQEQYRYYQDTTWKETQSAIEGLDYLFPIPPETSGTGRYVQYPRLHALLNEQDLNSVSHYFHEAGILPRFRYSFDEFLGTLSLPDIAQHPKASAHFRRMANDDDKHELLFEQIYRWFNKWDGNPIKIENRRGTLESKQRIRVSEPENLLTLTSNKKGDSWQIQIIDSKGKLIKNLGFSEKLLSRINGTFPIPNVGLGHIFFEYDTQYEEFVFCPKLHVGQKCAVIRDVSIRPIGIHLRTDKFPDLIRTFVGQSYEIFVFSLTGDNVSSLPPEWTTGKENPFSLKNGIRISRNEWLQGAGPEFVTDGGIDHLWLDGQRINFEESTNSLDLTDVGAGHHAIVVPRHSTLFFSIVSPNGNTGSRIESGWEIANCCPTKESTTLIGCYLDFPSERVSSISVSPVREWINSILTPDSKNSSNTIVIKSLNRTKNGLRPR